MIFLKPEEEILWAFFIKTWELLVIDKYPQKSLLNTIAYSFD